MNLSVFLSCINLLIVCFVATENTVPVFVLDYDQVLLQVRVDRNPLKKVSSNDFAQLVKETAKYKVIIFLEESFSVEDISTKDPFYGTPFKNLQSNLCMDKNTVKYLPSVIQPRKVLRATFPQKADKIINLAQRTKLQLKGNFNYVYMQFQDLKNETKANIFKRHDSIIKDVMGALRAMQAGPIVAFYTGKVNRLAVKKIERTKGSKHKLTGKVVVAQSSRILFRLYGVYVTTPTRRFYYDQKAMIVQETRTKHKLTAEFPVFNFRLLWRLQYFPKSIVITDLSMYGLYKARLIAQRKLFIEIAKGHSYYCDMPITMRDKRDGGSITVQSIFIDPAYNESAGEQNPIQYCNTFLAIEAFNCFIVAYVLLFLLVIALIPLLDCSGNSRLDQPDGRYLIHEKLH